MPEKDNPEKVVIFDSCVFWGHNEVELGVWRAERYKMGMPYFDAYKKVMGVSEPREDCDARNALYAIRYDLLWSALFPDEIKYRDMKWAMAEMQRLVGKFPKVYEAFEAEAGVN
ncbi:hypothetical protein BDW74DRAFT_178341 [Aspergillus multicolor]|uniref:uncharacterized protein n=1 Tax=Aspergillus multicolor TaxID=41759 RepID=UPI003CCCCE89